MNRLVFVLMLAFMMSCESEYADPFDGPALNVPPGFPDPIFPGDNELTPERWALGKRLFFDPVLSRDSSISCASCHQPALAFTDGKSVSEGIEDRPGVRNAPTLANVAYNPYLMVEGGVPTLEMQVPVPIQEHAEFDFNILLIAEKLKKDQSYVEASLEAYGKIPDPFVITRAIACFERTLLSGESRYDAYINGNTSSLNASEKKGMELFFSERLACTKCHGGFTFTNFTFQNNGLYENYTDPGRFRLTGIESDRALFKVPTLRNAGVTAPYMHDGSMHSLEEVVAHYNSGGKNHRHKSEFIKPLSLTIAEQHDLIAFLRTLTDENFLSDPRFHP